MNGSADAKTMLITPERLSQLRFDEIKGSFLEAGEGTCVLPHPFNLVPINRPRSDKFPEMRSPMKFDRKWDEAAKARTPTLENRAPKPSEQKQPEKEKERSKEKTFCGLGTKSVFADGREKTPLRIAIRVPLVWNHRNPTSVMQAGVSRGRLRLLQQRYRWTDSKGRTDGDILTFVCANNLKAPKKQHGRFERVPLVIARQNPKR